MKTEEITPESTAHNIGDRLTIENLMFGHSFNIGQTITIKTINKFDYLCTDDNGNMWWCADQNFIK